MTLKNDIIIAGGGLVGNALALGCAQAGFQVTVVDPIAKAAQISPQFDGRVSAIAIASVRILRALGVWQRVIEYAEPITDIRVVDGSAPVFLHFDADEIGNEPFGYMVENRQLRKALFDAIQDTPQITAITGESITDYTSDAHSVTASLSNHTALEASVLVAADGRFSTLRDKAQLPYRMLEYGQTAMVCTVSHSNPHHGLALERFLPAGPFAMLPMRDSHSCVVWTESDTMAPHYMALSDEAFTAEIEARAGEYWGNITLAGNRYSYPLRLMFAEKMIGQRFALIGDAAHGIHPIAGQGVNLGYRDVAVMVEVFKQQAALGLDIGSARALAHYARWRRFDSTSMTAMTDGLDRLFSNGNPALSVMRKFGLGIVNRLPPVKHFFMRQAMGLVGDIPPMMRN